MPSRNRKQTRRERRAHKKQRAVLRRRMLLGLAILGALLVVGYRFSTRSVPVEVSAERLADNPSRGPAAAAVTITEFGDFGCPACRAWHQAGVLDEIEQRYGDQVRIVWRDLPIITPQSPKAAEAGQCAYDQDRFWDYHDILFERAPRLAVGQLKDYALEIGLDMEKFNQCLDSGQHAETVDRDLREAFQSGLRSTPSFLVNDQPLIGANPQAMFQMIEFNLSQR